MFMDLCTSRIAACSSSSILAIVATTERNPSAVSLAQNDPELSSSSKRTYLHHSMSQRG